MHRAEGLEFTESAVADRIGAKSGRWKPSLRTMQRGPPNAKVSGTPDGGPGGARLAVSTRATTLQPAPNAVPVRVSEGPQGKSREPGPGVRRVRFTVLLGGPVPGLAVPIAVFGAMQ